MTQSITSRFVCARSVPVRQLSSKRAQQNHHAILSWTVRFARICDFIAEALPDIITLQELDHMADMQVALGRLGYAVRLFLP